ncbi:PspC domain-containing protein [Nocardioides solisilvae]|uniref:PspC domain-containing protein n=1 Tax=Nocardioides solisilvae TaxID=1542435 RepID=UPI0013A5787E|nr:PspC domain-containing protein [Nocardioides solisilvae]
MNDTTDLPGAPGGPGSPGGPGTPGAAPSPGPRVGRDELRDVGRLRRPHDRQVAGVAAGLARHLDVDPLVLRIAFVVLAFFGGAGLVLYGALWLLLPEDGADRAPLHLDERSRGLAVVGAGVLAALLLLGDSWNLYWFPWPLALLALAVWFFFFRDGAGNAPVPPAPPTYAGSTSVDPVDPAGRAEAAPVAPPGSYAATYVRTPLPPRPPLTRPRDPRRRGPRLFWFTCALVVLALGVLGTVDLAGAPVTDSAYPALALGIVAVLLVVGAFWGRAGGLVALGLLASAVMAGSLATEEFRGEHLAVVPDTAAQVQADYEMGAGELVLDLREVADLDALDGRRVHVSGGVGRIEVLLPEELGAVVRADVGGPGRVTLFDSVDRGGVATGAEASVRDDGDLPVLDLDLELGVGEVLVTTPGGDDR